MMARAVMEMVASTHGVTVEAMIARTRLPHLDRARTEAYAALDERGFSRSQIARMFQRDRSAVTYALNRRVENAIQQKAHDIEDFRQNYEEYQAQLRRLSGVDLADRITVRLGMHYGEAVTVAILAERYPDPLRRDKWLQLYDEAMTMHKGEQTFSSGDVLKQMVSKTRKWFAAKGLPDPIVRLPDMLHLSPEVAPWLQAQFGVPAVISMTPRAVV